MVLEKMIGGRKGRNYVLLVVENGKWEDSESAIFFSSYFL